MSDTVVSHEQANDVEQQQLSLDSIWHNGKQYRKGYTTGSCATAAAKVAALMVLRQQVIDQISIVTPSGITLNLNVEQPLIEGRQATAAIRKDGGDDVDATHGMLIFARVTVFESTDDLPQQTDITLRGGEGVGTVTRKGIGLPVGSSAINRTPQQTIEAAVREVIGPLRGASVEIFAPEGEERAKKTYNGRLGILGGISIIGTTGIVTPMSEESWKRSLALELEMKRAAGEDRVILVPGNHGERFVRDHLGLDSQRVVTMSNFVGYMLQETVRLGFRRVLLVGHPGKLVKVAAGIFHTHSHIADGRMETLVANLALMGAPHALLLEVNQCDTTEAAMELIAEQGWQQVYTRIAERICERINEMMRFSVNPPQCDAILFSFDNQVLGSSRPLDEILEALR
ncbi:cobalt-precorrin-5B (C(1))-methyltransferase CbiD [Yersinia massiliensis]|uniref:cobalt-precorrin-5B (C(1))-methyltransferase CbiD n=1 Tax=Yersinia massiliensis TaxID=419257 RepID=UPI0005B639AA|nr:cobalt-precorrin-5B (C(1))-methyltransferase CbiD [Yersinia massiliensis]